MKTGHFAALALALLLAQGTALAEEPMLGVVVKNTPGPGATDSQAQPTLTPEPALTPEATPGEAERLFSQEQLEAAGLGERILTRGMEGEDVALMQARLAQLGYYLGEIDGVFGLQTRSAVYAFQRAHKLGKIDGKVGPETIGRMFGEDVIVKPTPTPSPTPTPAPTPVPTPTPEASPTPTPKPDAAGAPFAMEELEMVVAGEPVTLVVGRDEEGELLYPLCGVMERMGYAYAYAAGSWQLTRESDGAEIALMTDGADGPCESAMGAADGVIFLADEQRRVFAYGQEAYLNGAALGAFGVRVSLSGETPVIR